MFEKMSYYTLQQYWWLIISILAGFLVFLLFVQGGQTLIRTLGKQDKERTIIVNTFGRKWEFTFTTLVTFGGAFFASFPLFYSVSFGGAYWVWMIILFSFVIQAIAYEYRSKPDNFLGSRTYETFLLINGTLGTVLIGTAVGTFFNGANFELNEYNFSKWSNSYHGLEAVLTFHNVALGITIFFLARVLALLYIFKNVENDAIIKNARKQLIINVIPFLAFFLYFVVVLLLKDGFSYDPASDYVYEENFKYLHNFLDMPVILILFLAGVLAVLFGIGRTIFSGTFVNGIWYAGPGVFLVVLCLFLITGYNYTAYYPSLTNIQYSLTIENSSSSRFTLTVMSYVSLIVPFVLAYIIYAWRSVNNKKIDIKELENESHVY